MKDGVLLINKPSGLTSRDVVNKIVKIYQTKKVGHTGTLDPLATGVLIVCLGKYTKLVEELTSKEKEYIATMQLGIETDTLDTTGQVLKTKEVTVSKEKVLKKSTENKDLEDLKPFLGFKHNLQSLVTAMSLEKNYGNYGLDLTNFTLYGIQRHSGTQYKQGKIKNHDMLGYYDSFISRGCSIDCNSKAWSLESFVVAEADEIAQRHHDVEDAIRGGLIAKNEILDIITTNFSNYLNSKEIKELKKSAESDIETFISTVSRIIVNLYVTRLVHASIININHFICKNDLTQKKFAQYLQTHCPNDDEVSQLISYSILCESEKDFEEKSKEFQGTITRRVLSSYDIQRMDAKGKYIIKKMFQAYYHTPQQLPDHSVCEFLTSLDSKNYSHDNLMDIIHREGIGKVRDDFFKILNGNTYDFTKKRLILMRVICNFIAGMTDSFATKTYEELYG